MPPMTSSMRCRITFPAVTYPRTPGYRPEGEENKYNAWYVKTTIKGAPSGKLAGKTVALKDNVSLAGVPMMNGASTLEGYIPTRMPPSSRVSSMPAAPSSARPIANISAFPAAAIPTRRARPQPSQDGIFVRRLVFGQRRRGGHGRSRYGDRRRPGRIDPHPCLVLRRLRHEGNARPRALYRGDADRDYHRPYRTDDPQRCATMRCCSRCLPGADGLDPRQTAPKVASYTQALEGGVKGLRIGIVKEGFGLPSLRARRRCQGDGGCPAFQKARRDRR